MLSDQRSKVNDLFEAEVKALEAKYNEKKKPLLQKRNEIVLGQITDFSEFVPKYDETFKQNEIIAAGIVKT
jgi:exosome complex RNA-binding protein Csl4